MNTINKNFTEILTISSLTKVFRHLFLINYMTVVYKNAQATLNRLKTLSMKKIVLLFLIILSTEGVFSQTSFKIKASVDNTYGTKAYLLSYYGYKNQVIDTAISIDNKNYIFNLPKNSEQGIYKILFSSGYFIDIIFTQKNISFKADLLKLHETIEFKNSDDNTLYYKTTKIINSFDSQIWKISYSKLDSLEKLNRINKLEQKKYLELNTIIKNNKNKLFTKYILAQQIPKNNKANTNKKKFLKKHFFDNIDFSDSRLIRSPIIALKIRAYFYEFYKNTNTQQYKKAVNMLMTKAAVNKKMNDFVLNEIFELFEKNENIEILDWLLKKYSFNKQCAIEINSKEKQNVIKHIKNNAIGSIAQDFQLMSLSSSLITLSEVEAEYILLFFWRTKCTHCIRMIDKLKKIYSKYNPMGLKVIAISLDFNKDEWESIVSKYSLNWINVSDLFGLKSPLIKKYNIKFTPKIYLLNHEKKILAKPTNSKETESMLKKYYKK